MCTSADVRLVIVHDGLWKWRATPPAEQAKPAETKAPKDQAVLTAAEQATGKIETQPVETTNAPGLLRVPAASRALTKQFQIVIDPVQLTQYGLTLHDVAVRVEQNNTNLAAGISNTPRNSTAAGLRESRVAR